MSAPLVYSYSDVPATWSAPTSGGPVGVPTDKRLLPVCKLTGLVGVAVGDYESDTDLVPEAKTLNGSGRIVPLLKKPVLAPHFKHGALALKLFEIPFDIINGKFYRNGIEGVGLLAGDQYTSPQQIPYGIYIYLNNEDNVPVEFPYIEFNAVQGTLDWTMLSPIPAEEPINVSRGPRGDSFVRFDYSQSTDELVSISRDANGNEFESGRTPFDGTVVINGATSVVENPPGSGLYEEI